ncbi:MAG: glycosyltransferase family 4 protein [Nocardioides sp.]|nr:glycosyltransferase family 4 protein [Nocardioides sp.]MDP3893769.1 glycosyltransferase family 4 protein [Nocardioides sp.]
MGRWNDDGYDVEVISSQPSYKPETELEGRPAKELVDGVLVRRIRMRPDRSGRLRRVFNTFWFPLAVAVRILLGPRHDVVMCSTSPPVLLGSAVSIAARARGAAFVYHCMDLHPEIGALSGEFANRRLYSVLLRLDTATCRRASTVIVLSRDMKQALLRRDASLADKIVVLNNFELPSFEESADAPSPLPRDHTRLRIAFTGNLGRFQGLESLTAAVLAGGPALGALEIVFMGEGAVKQALVDQVEAAPPEVRDRVRFVPHGSVAAARALLRTADVGLVSLIPQVIGFAYPSKTATYLSEGLPLLVSVEPESELAQMVVEGGIGSRLPTGDQKAVTETLIDLVSRRAELPGVAARARELGRSEFSAETLLPRWSRLLEDVAGSRPR